MSTPARPDLLKFDSIDAMLADVDRLRRGYAKAGRWDLGMVLDHLTKSMSGPFAGGWNLPWPLTAIGRAFVRYMGRRARYPSVKLPALPSLRPTAGVDEAAAVDRFRAVAEQVKALSGDTVAWPPFGRVRTSDFLGLHLLHGAHHLSFLQPTGE